MSSTPAVSVLMVTYRRPQFLTEALASLQQQTFQNWELILVDDSPGDDIERCLQRCSVDDRCRYFHRPGCRSGYANALNFALDHAQAPLLAILDDDDLWLDPHKLHKQIDFLRLHPEIGVCGSSALRIDETGAEVGRYRNPQHDAAIRSCLLFEIAMVHSSVVFRREVGRYDENLLNADWDLWLQAGKKFQFYNFPDCFCAVRSWRAQTTRTRQRLHARQYPQMIRRYRAAYPGYWRAILYHRLSARESAWGMFLRRYFRRPGRALGRLLFPHRLRLR